MDTVLRRRLRWREELIMKPPILGIQSSEIDKAEAELSVRFPPLLREAWETYNVVELRGGWRVFPIFDKRSPRKTCGSIVYENTRGAWKELQPDDTLAIADNGTGNQLVLKVENGKAGESVYHWNHETGRLRKWQPGIESILKEARRSRISVERLQAKFGK